MESMCAGATNKDGSVTPLEEIDSTESLAESKTTVKNFNRALIVNFTQRNPCKLTDTSKEFEKLRRENWNELIKFCFVDEYPEIGEAEGITALPTIKVYRFDTSCDKFVEEKLVGLDSDQMRQLVYKYKQPVLEKQEPLEPAI